MPVETTIQVRRDTAANWTSTNPTLAAGERGFETDTKLYKTGDGTTAWTSLGYEIDSQAVAKTLMQSSTAIHTIPRFANSGGVAMVSGTVYFTFFASPIDVTVTQISAITGGAAASGLTLARMGLYIIDSSDNATLVAQTASDTTLFTAGGTIYTRSFDTGGGYPSSYKLLTGQKYATGVIAVGTGMASLVSLTATALMAAQNPRLTGTVASQADLPTSRTSYTNSGASPYTRLS